MRWRDHVFNYAHEKNNNNVTNFFYRIEFQGRGTAHIHLLIWLKDLSKCSYEINGHIPLSDKNLSFLVYDIQPSTETILPLNEQCTSLTVNEHGKASLSLYYPQSAFALRLRAYISSLIPYLKCRMDVQFSQQAGMLMRFVSSYVSKFKDSQTSQSLYSTYLSPVMAVYRHLRELKPCEPEMITTLSDIKMAWCNNSTKRYVPPRAEYAKTDSVLKKYYNREKQLDMTLLDLLRTHDT